MRLVKSVQQKGSLEVKGSNPVKRRGVSAKASLWEGRKGERERGRKEGQRGRERETETHWCVITIKVNTYNIVQ